MHFLGISVCLRENSLIIAELRACQQLQPIGVNLSLFDIAVNPLYNEDVQAQGFPPAAEEQREQIAAADALDKAAV